MDLEKFIGCLIKFNGKIAMVVGARSTYDGENLYLEYAGSNSSFSVNAFDDEVLNALPDPEHGFLKRQDDNVLFWYKETDYTLGCYPYEPCLYIKKDGAIFRTLNNAFTTDELPERFANGEILMGINGKEYDQVAFCKVLAAAIDSNRTQMDFPFAAKLVQ